MNFTPQQVARKIAAAASDKKAKDILLLNMENLSPLTDYFVIASANNVTLVKAIADNIEKKLGSDRMYLHDAFRSNVWTGICNVNSTYP